MVAASVPASSSATAGAGRRVRALTFSDRMNVWFEACLDKVIDWCGNGMYWVGPVFVLTGLIIIAFTMYVGFTILLPAKDTAFSVTWVRTCQRRPCVARKQIQ